MLYEHIGSSNLLPTTRSNLTMHVAGLINQEKAWRDVAGE
jgi:hypothetical protein